MKPKKQITAMIFEGYFQYMYPFFEHDFFRHLRFTVELDDDFYIQKHFLKEAMGDDKEAN